jgi:hypothetical protein
MEATNTSTPTTCPALLLRMRRGWIPNSSGMSSRGWICRRVGRALALAFRLGRARHRLSRTRPTSESRTQRPGPPRAGRGLGHLVCVLPGGDHIIVPGGFVHANARPGMALIFCKGQYDTLTGADGMHTFVTSPECPLRRVCLGRGVPSAPPRGRLRRAAGAQGVPPSPRPSGDREPCRGGVTRWV